MAQITEWGMDMCKRIWIGLIFSSVVGCGSDLICESGEDESCCFVDETESASISDSDDGVVPGGEDTGAVVVEDTYGDTDTGSEDDLDSSVDVDGGVDSGSGEDSDTWSDDDTSSSPDTGSEVGMDTDTGTGEEDTDTGEEDTDTGEEADTDTDGCPYMCVVFANYIDRCENYGMITRDEYECPILGKPKLCCEEDTDTGEEDTDTGAEDTDTGEEDTGTGEEDTDTGGEDTDTGEEDTDTGEEVPTSCDMKFNLWCLSLFVDPDFDSCDQFEWVHYSEFDSTCLAGQSCCSPN